MLSDYESRASRQMIKLPGGGGRGKIIYLSFYSVSVYGRGFLLNERIYYNRALRQMATLPGGGGGRGGERETLSLGVCVCGSGSSLR